MLLVRVTNKLTKRSPLTAWMRGWRAVCLVAITRGAYLGMMYAVLRTYSRRSGPMNRMHIAPKGKRSRCPGMQYSVCGLQTSLLLTAHMIRAPPSLDENPRHCQGRPRSVRLSLYGQVAFRRASRHSLDVVDDPPSRIARAEDPSIVG